MRCNKYHAPFACYSVYSATYEPASHSCASQPPPHTLQECKLPPHFFLVIWCPPMCVFGPPPLFLGQPPLFLGQPLSTGVILSNVWTKIVGEASCRRNFGTGILLNLSGEKLRQLHSFNLGLPRRFVKGVFLRRKRNNSISSGSARDWCITSHKSKKS